MNTDVFQSIVDRTSEKLTKKPTNMRVPISPQIKLAVTLRFLATGESYASCVIYDVYVVISRKLRFSSDFL